MNECGHGRRHPRCEDCEIAKLQAELDAERAKCASLTEVAKNLNRKMLQGCVGCASCGSKCVQCCFDDQVLSNPDAAATEILKDRERLDWLTKNVQAATSVTFLPDPRTAIDLAIAIEENP